MGDRPRRRWSDLTVAQRRAISAAGLVQVGLLVAAQLDLARRPARDVNGDKRLWAGLNFINFLGPLAYFLLGRRR